MSRRNLSIAGVLLCGALVLGSCGDPSSPTVAPTTASPTTTFAPTTAATTTTTATTIAPTTTTVAPTTTTTAVAVVEPATEALPTEQAAEAPAAEPAAPETPDLSRIPRDAIGFIEIPKLNMGQFMLEGIDISILNRGPGHWPGTAMPGQVGNVVVAGHRTSHSRPFRYIDTLEIGDEMFLTVGLEKFRYVVTGHEVVKPDAVWIVDQTETATATLFACHPPGATTYRWVTRFAYEPVTA